MLLYRPRVVKLLNHPGGMVWALKPPESHPWALVHKTTYAPMIYTALCVMLLMWATSISWASGRGSGPGNLDFLGPKWLDAISQGQKKVSISRAQPPPTCPRNSCCPHQKLYARDRINHRCINSKSAMGEDWKNTINIL
jgi:hypothetical protein